MSTQHSEFIIHLVERLSDWQLIQSKRMFGGHGLFLEGLMFALVSDEILYFKTDHENRADFEALDLEPFTYMRQGKPCQLSYYAAPEETMDDDEALIEWAKSGFSAALRAHKGPQGHP